MKTVFPAKAALLNQMQEEALGELSGNILPFWMNQVADSGSGGFTGRIDGYGVAQPEALRGGIMNARILWTFSSAYNLLNEVSWLEAANRSWQYIFNHFIDRSYGGTFWTVDPNGNPADTKKQIYAQAFFIYAFSECFKATGNQTALQEAIDLYRLVEAKSADQKKNGYLEAFGREWELLADLRLSSKDENEVKTANTHLHILEAYTSLFRVWPDVLLGERLKNLTGLFIEKMTDENSGHLRLFFNEDWECKSSLVSYGHDIETSWLLHDAAIASGDAMLLSAAEKTCVKMAMAALEGFMPDGSMIYESDPVKGFRDEDRHWWPQAEAVAGLLNLASLTGESQYFDMAANCWKYILNHLVDKEKGEWFWSIRADGSVNRNDDKAGFWKCPYHNGRACMEIIRRSDSGYARN